MQARFSCVSLHFSVESMVFDENLSAKLPLGLRPRWPASAILRRIPMRMMLHVDFSASSRARRLSKLLEPLGCGVKLEF